MPTCIDGKYNWKNIFEKNMKAAAKLAIFEDRGRGLDRQEGNIMDREEENYLIHVHLQRAKAVAENIAIALLA